MIWLWEMGRSRKFLECVGRPFITIVDVVERRYPLTYTVLKQRFKSLFTFAFHIC